MPNTIFKGFKMVTTAVTTFEADYLYFVRTNDDKLDGYLYFNGKKYGTALDAANELKSIIGTLPEEFSTVADYIENVYNELNDAISTETANREAAVTAEATARENADKEFENALNDEIDAREAAVSSLTDELHELEQTVEEDEAVTASALTNLDERIKSIEDLTGQTHTHANKEVLDGITAEKVEAWDAAEQNAKDYTDSAITELDAAVTGSSSGVTVTVTQTDGKLTEATAELHVSAAENNAVEIKEDGIFAAIYVEDLDV